MPIENQPAELTATAKLKEKLQQRIDEARQRLEDVKSDIANLHHENQEDIRKKRAEIQQRIDAQQERARDVRDQVSGWLREKAEQGEEAITSWRQKRAIKRLESRADRAEEYAVNALVVAMMDADEAEMAMLDALQARLDAEAAYSTST